MNYFPVLCCFAALMIPCRSAASEAVLEQYKGKFAKIYSPGVINPKEGTVEISIRPDKPASEFENEWSFALSMIPGQAPAGNPDARTIFGIYTTSGEHNNRMLMGIARNNKSESFSCGIPTAKVLEKRKDMNLALSWGQKGLTLHVNGRKVAGNSFNGFIDPMSGTFSVCNGVPFSVRAVRVSVRQLSDNELDPDPATPFSVRPDTSFIGADGMDKGQYFITPVMGDYSSLMPVWSMPDSFTVSGKEARQRMIAANFSKNKVDYRVNLKIFDVDMHEIGTKDYVLTLPPMSTAKEESLLLPLEKTGFYHLEMTISLGDAVSRKWVFSHAVIPAEEAGIRDGVFCEYLGHHLFNLPEVLAKMNIRWCRSDAFPWYVVEPEKGRFEWAWSDKIVNDAVAKGINLLGILGVPPVWAADSKVIPTHPNAYMSGRRKPASLEEWENYVYQVVSRYKDRVRHWEIWNEADWHPPAPAASYSGSTADYFELLKRACAAAKKADPESRILISGFGFGTTCDTEMPFELLRMGAAKYCDIYNVHSYRALSGIDELLDALKKADPAMPIWQTEQMWHTVADTRRQSILTAAIFFWFIDRKFEKYFSFGEDFFFSHHTLCPNPVVSTIANVQNLLRKCGRFDGLLQDQKLQYYDLKHQFRRSDGSFLTVLGRIGTPVEMRFSSRVNRIVDVYGRDIPFSESAGQVIPSLPFEIAFIISPDALVVAGEKAVSDNLCSNGGFELVSGDVAMIGIERLEPSGWRFREKNYDPEGRIGVSSEAKSGKYALKMESSGKGRVYAFFEQKISAPGAYQFSFWAKSSGSKPVPAYVDVYDLSSRAFKRHQVGVIAAGEFRRYDISLNFDKPSLANVAFSIGLEQTGGIIIDDVSLKPFAAAVVSDVKSPRIDSGISAQVFRRDKDRVAIGELLKQCASKPVIDGIPFVQSQRPLMLSKAPWSNIAGADAVIPLQGKFQEAVLLLTAMYVPNDAAGLMEFKWSYDNGQNRTVVLENRKHLRDWFLALEKGVQPAIKYAVAPNYHEYGVFMARIKNPEPDLILKALELRAMDSSLICILAVSAIPTAK